MTERIDMAALRAARDAGRAAERQQAEQNRVGYRARIEMYRNAGPAPASPTSPPASLTANGGYQDDPIHGRQPYTSRHLDLRPDPDCFDWRSDQHLTRSTTQESTT